MNVGPCVLIAIPLLLAASASDLTARMVSNRVCMALGLDGVAMQAVAHTLPVSILAMLAVFIPAFVLWRHGIMGGGDAKLFAATALLVHPAAVPMLVLAITLAGGVLGLVYWTMMRLLSKRMTSSPADPFRRILRIERHRICRGFSLPYAVAISVGTFYVFGKELAS
ncbi:MAG: A24 family peptidase [Janthinobacterium lividum]